MSSYDDWEFLFYAALYWLDTQTQKINATHLLFWI